MEVPFVSAAHQLEQRGHKDGGTGTAHLWRHSYKQLKIPGVPTVKHTLTLPVFRVKFLGCQHMLRGDTKKTVLAGCLGLLKYEWTV